MLDRFTFELSNELLYLSKREFHYLVNFIKVRFLSRVRRQSGLYTLPVIHYHDLAKVWTKKTADNTLRPFQPISKLKKIIRQLKKLSYYS